MLNSRNRGKGKDARGIKVLHIDDEEDFLNLSAEFMERENDRIDVVTTTEASEVLELIDGADCVVSDYRMPDADGLDLLKQVRERKPDIPFILFTGKGSEDVASEAISAGVTDYLRKGGTEKYKLLANRIEKAAEEYSMRRFERATKQSPFCILERVTDAFYALDTEWRFTYVNEEAAEVFGKQPPELLGERIWDAYPEAKETPFYDHYREVMEEQEPRTIEEPFEPWGKWYREHLYPSENGLSVISRDVTERKKREEELERSRDLLGHTERLANAGGWEYDLEAETLRWTQGVREIHGLPDDYEPSVEEALEFYHPEDRETVREAFKNCVDTGEPYDKEVRIMTEDGSLRWVRTHGEAVTEGERVTEVRGAIRDITDQRRYRAALEGVNRQTKDLLQAETEEEIARTVVDAATEVLELPTVAVYTYDEDECELAPVSWSEDAESVVGDLPHFSPGEGIAWEVFTDGEKAVFDDVRKSEKVYNPETHLRSELMCPLGRHGVLLAAGTEVGAFDEHTLKLVEILAATAEAAFDRSERVYELREEREESERRAENLERVQQLNDEIRTLNRTLVESVDGDEIKESVCESLVGLDKFKFAWIGEPNLASDKLGIATHAGSGEEFLNDVSLSFGDTENDLPEAKVARSREAVVENRITDDLQSEEWRNVGLLHGFRSVATVPLTHGDVLYGVLSIYSDEADAFDDLTTSVLTELGELVRYALNSVEQRNALMGEGGSSLTFELTEPEDPFVELSSDLGAEVDVVNVARRSENISLVQFHLEGVGEDEVRDVASDTVAFRDLRLVSDPSEDDDLRFEGVVVGDTLATEMVSLGAKLDSLVVSEGVCRTTLTVPGSRDKRELVERLRSEYSEAELKAQYNTGSSARDESRDSPELTERQEDILRTAYYGGYFDKNRKSTGSEIAESLDISQPAFSKQLRTAQNKVLGSIYGDGR